MVRIRTLLPCIAPAAALTLATLPATPVSAQERPW